MIEYQYILVWWCLFVGLCVFVCISWVLGGVACCFPQSRRSIHPHRCKDHPLRSCLRMFSLFLNGLAMCGLEVLVDVLVLLLCWFVGCSLC